jgi:LDH2 family malate/lactate/ureidoglycolate dehydrogenase
MAADRVEIPIAQAQAIAQKALMRQGYDDSEADAIAEVLLYAELRGNDQGLAKLIGTGYPKDPNVRPVEVETRTSVSAMLDGRGTAGILVLRQAAALAAEIAGASGVAVVGTHNTISSTGCLGYYAKGLAGKGLVALVFAGSRQAVAPYGSSEALLGTNPIAVGIPTGGEPFVADVATAAATWYSLVAASAAGRRIPPGVAYDASGQETTDPSMAMNGAIRTFGQSHKSSALSVVVELLTGPIVSAVSSEDGARLSWGNLIIAFQPRLLVQDVESMYTALTAVLERLRRARPAPGQDVVRLPGAAGDALAQQNTARGRVSIDASVYHELSTDV